MSVTPLRPIYRFEPGAPLPQSVVSRHPTNQTLALALLREGLVDAHTILQAITLQESRGSQLVDILLSGGDLQAADLYAAMARHWSVGVVDLANQPPDPRLLARIDHVTILRDCVLPWRKVGEITIVLTAYPQDFAQHQDALQTIFGPVAMALAPMQAIEVALLNQCGPQLARRAETRVDLGESCRSLESRVLRGPAVLICACLALFGIYWPVMLMAGLAGLAIVAMFSFSFVKAAAFFAMQRPMAVLPRAVPFSTKLPVVSAMVALYRESDIAERLISRLDRLDYPRDLLDILLVVEAEDTITREALDRAVLPGWMRVVMVPNGTVKTKPRALNYALDHCCGSIIGIYDAEDAPEPDQLRKVVDQFQQRGPDVACLQGVLDFYNPHSNWMARCFTIEYASWFRMFLPGIERLGLALPLGGTTLFFRREALESLGGWDAQNVTEDADLGIRLARHGLRTELLDSVTFEEANCRSFPWIKQRSRWIKGYMMTYLSHMRDPVLLWQQLGPRRFLGFQTQFLGSVLQSLLAPLVWSFWLMPLGIQHPVSEILPAPLFTTIYLAMFAVTFLTISFDIAGLRRTQHRMNPVWALTLMFYHPLATLAAYKALWELVTKPFYWDKTSHGHFDP